jgi:hypothetical protein
VWSRFCVDRRRYSARVDSVDWRERLSGFTTSIDRKAKAWNGRECRMQNAEWDQWRDFLCVIRKLWQTNVLKSCEILCQEFRMLWIYSGIWHITRNSWIFESSSSRISLTHSQAVNHSKDPKHGLLCESVSRIHRGYPRPKGLCGVSHTKVHGKCKSTVGLKANHCVSTRTPLGREAVAQNATAICQYVREHYFEEFPSTRIAQIFFFFFFGMVTIGRPFSGFEGSQTGCVRWAVAKGNSGTDSVPTGSHCTPA